MQRTLSVRHTALLKFLLPPVWLAVVAYAVWQLWSSPEEVLSDGEAGAATLALKWLFLALVAVSLVVLFAFVVPLKRVRLEPDGLRISNYFREITVPFSAIARVRQNWLPTYRLVTLDLRTETPLGRRVIFMPAGPRRWAFWRADYRREDEVVAELRALAGLTDQKASPAAFV
ncbi:MAG: PH domain-containing protein [Gemmatimonadaceae bacterium]